VRSQDGTAYADYFAQLERIAASRSQARRSEKNCKPPIISTGNTKAKQFKEVEINGGGGEKWPRRLWMLLSKNG
jgi:hypothetical protein